MFDLAAKKHKVKRHIDFNLPANLSADGQTLTSAVNSFIRKSNSPILLTGQLSTAQNGVWAVVVEGSRKEPWVLQRVEF